MIFAICDDNREAAAYIASAIKQRYGQGVQTVEFYSADNLISYITHGSLPDCIFMDIVLGEDNGIDELRKYIEYLRDIPVIFFTGFTEYCQDIFLNFSPYGLLTKPIDDKKLYYYTDKIVLSHDENSINFVVSMGKDRTLLKNSDVLYVENEKRKVIYHTVNGDYAEYIKMDDALDKLRYGFIRCHKSFAVNFRNIKTIDKNYVVLSDGTEIQISRQYSESAQSDFISLKSKSLGI